MVLYNPVTLDYPPKLKPAVVRWVKPGWNIGGLVAGIAMNDGGIYYDPVFVEEDTTYIRIGVDVTTLVAAATLDLRIFAASNGVPGALVLDAGNVSLAALGLKEIVISQRLTRGLYFLARRTAAGNPAVLRGVNIASCCTVPVAGGATTLSASLPCLYVAAAWADPAPAPTDWNNHNEACIWLREN